jgi:hypothetical protein
METVPDEDEMGPMDLTLGEHKLEEDVAPSPRPEPQLTYYELRRRYLSHGHGDKTKDRVRLWTCFSDPVDGFSRDFEAGRVSSGFYHWTGAFL